MRNATSTEPSSGSSADLQAARRGCIELGRQAESIAELLFPLLRQATVELGRLEAQRDELRKASARDTQQNVLPRLLERIDEQVQGVKRLERASRGLKEFTTALSGFIEQLQSGLARHEEEQREQEAITREEKRMWLQELTALRAQSIDPSAAQQEELQRLRTENEALPRLRAERDLLAHRVAELEKNVINREQMLSAKEQTIEDLRRMIVLLTPKAPPKPRSAEKPTENLFGNNTMQLASSLLETLGSEVPPPPVAREPLVPEPRVPSEEIVLGPLDELEPPRPAMPPPVPPVPLLSTPTPRPLMPKASARIVPSGPAMTPAPVPARSPLSPERPGTLVISEDMFNDILAEENYLGPPGKK